jgi:hypothetical protein
MSIHSRRPGRALALAWVIALLLVLGGALAASAHDDGTPHPEPANLPQVAPAGVAAACAGGPTIDGITLDECVDRTFTVGGVNKTVRVWYTKVANTATRTEDGTTYTLEHWIDTDAQAQQVAAWFEDAWQRYYADSGHHLYDNGCSRLNVQMEDGIGWSGIAYWGSSGNCRIGIDSPMVRGGGGQWTVYHEAQHYLQYSYDAGCYGYLKPNYPEDSEFVEGYADLGSDTVNAALDATGYGGSTYDASTSMYDKSYGNIFLKYFIEQLGTIGTPTDPWHRIDAMYNHYSACDAADNLYVLDTLIPSLKPGMTEKKFFLDFFAANWAKDWANPTTQPELVYTDDDASPYGNLASLTQDVTMSGGAQSWTESTPDDWAARYYQVTPQTGCPYLQVEVDGASGAQLGINLMAAKTTAPTTVLRSAVVGEDYVRTFAAAGVNNRVVAAVNSFSNNYSYTVRFTCVTPTVNILEPRQVKFAMVGAPDSPISFLARWSVRDGVNNVRGLPESAFTFDAEGAPVTVVPGTFQEVGDEYWAVLLPPVKPAGTTFVDFKVNLGTINDTELDALLYVAPGNTDIALSFDASGSMNEVDAIGEGSRLTNAMKAGQVIADLLRVGDRILVQDWSAFNNPVNCGIPSGAGNCALDIRTLLPRNDVTAGNLTTLIGSARAQINAITAREWTPVGAGLKAAKDALVANPGNTNPKHIFLLSDGQENVKPLYAEVKDEIKDSGVVVNTIAFGPEAPGDLMATIAADTGGIYRPVSTNGIGSGMPAGLAAGASAAAAVSSIAAIDDVNTILAAPYLPGQLGLANVYDYFDTEAQGAARVFNGNYLAVPAFDNPNSQKVLVVNVDKSVNQLRLVVAGKQPDDETGCTVSDIRRVDVLMPGMDPQKRWLPISPRESFTPADWDIRNNRFDDVLVINNPAEGQWQFRTYYYPVNCIPYPGQAQDGSQMQDAAQVPTQVPAGADSIAGVDAVSANGGPYDFIMNVSVQSTIQLEGRLLGLDGGKAEAGATVSILGLLLDKNGTVPATAMLAVIDGPAGSVTRALFDDGNSNDGVAGDGIYGAKFAETAYGGGYGVRIVAVFKDPANPAQNLLREWNGGFWIKGPKPVEQCGSEEDKDKDCMPDKWELRCKLNLEADDRQLDNDGDGLTNIQELNLGTLPCRADTDKGGENDGSEVRGNRNPLNPRDDKVRPLGHISVRPLNGQLIVRWTNTFSYTNMILYVSDVAGELGKGQDVGQGSGQGGEHVLDGLQNDKTYYIVLQGVSKDESNNTVYGDLSDPIAATPKADPDMPSGTMLIQNGAARTYTSQVQLNISATDRPLEGAAQGSAAHMTDMLSQQINVVSGNVQMRIGNTDSLQGVPWQPLQSTVPWTLPCSPGQVCTVYAQFRDGAGNESLIVNDSILLLQSTNIYMPQVKK